MRTVLESIFGGVVALAAIGALIHYREGMSNLLVTVLAVLACLGSFYVSRTMMKEFVSTFLEAIREIKKEL